MNGIEFIFSAFIQIHLEEEENYLFILIRYSGKCNLLDILGHSVLLIFLIIFCLFPLMENKHRINLSKN